MSVEAPASSAPPSGLRSCRRLRLPQRDGAVSARLLLGLDAFSTSIDSAAISTAPRRTSARGSPAPRVARELSGRWRRRSRRDARARRAARDLVRSAHGR